MQHKYPFLWFSHMNHERYSNLLCLLMARHSSTYKTQQINFTNTMLPNVWCENAGHKPPCALEWTSKTSYLLTKFDDGNPLHKELIDIESFKFCLCICENWIPKNWMANNSRNVKSPSSLQSFLSPKFLQLHMYVILFSSGAWPWQRGLITLSSDGVWRHKTWQCHISSCSLCL
jgi:hypothetical protein